MIVQRHDAPRGFRAADNIFTGANTFEGITTFTGDIVAGTIDADFNDLTATTYGGIPEAALFDKTATTETISGVCTFNKEAAASIIFAAASGPIGLEWLPTGNPDTDHIRLIYRTTPQSVIFERVSDGADILAIRPDNKSAIFSGAVTAVSYGGIPEANLVDKTASEVITGAREWRGNVGFYSTTPIAKQTGVPVTAAGVHAALVNLGLIT